MPQRECPPGKIVNPASGRCVLINGQIGKRILRQQAMEAGVDASPRVPACPPGKIYNLQTDRCVNVRGVPGRRILQQVHNFLDARNPMLHLLPPEVMLDIWGYAYERPKNCGRLVRDLKDFNIPATKTILQRSVVKTLQKLKRILALGHYTKYARINNHENELKSIMEWTSTILQNAKRRNATIDQLIGYCRKIVAVKEKTSAMVEQLQTSLRLAEDYLRTGDLPLNFTGNLLLSPSELPRIRRLRHSIQSDAAIIRRVIHSFRKRFSKDQMVLTMLKKPIDIRK